MNEQTKIEVWLEEELELEDEPAFAAETPGGGLAPGQDNDNINNDVSPSQNNNKGVVKMEMKTPKTGGKTKSGKKGGGIKNNKLLDDDVDDNEPAGGHAAPIDDDREARISRTLKVFL